MANTSNTGSKKRKQETWYNIDQPTSLNGRPMKTFEKRTADRVARSVTPTSKRSQTASAVASRAEVKTNRVKDRMAAANIKPVRDTQDQKSRKRTVTNNSKGVKRRGRV